MNSRVLLWVAIVALLMVPVGASAADAKPPNIVMIVSDDQGWRDFGFMGHPAIRTPNLDRLASQSLTCTNGYVTTPLCRPSLATMLTGLYPHQHKITGNDPPAGQPRESMWGFMKEAPALPRLLREKGYRSFQTGKWWEGHHHYIDPENKYVFLFVGNLGQYVSYNTKAVDPVEFRSYWDFLQPKWKGKILSRDPRISGSQRIGLLQSNVAAQIWIDQINVALSV